MYTLSSTLPSDMPTIRRLVPGGQTKNPDGSKGAVLAPGTAQSLRAAAGLAEDLGPHITGKVVVHGPRGERVDQLTLAAEVASGRLSGVRA